MYWGNIDFNMAVHQKNCGWQTQSAYTLRKAKKVLRVYLFLDFDEPVGVAAVICLYIIRVLKVWKVDVRPACNVP